MPATGSERRWRPRWTLRLRLTLLYGALFLMAGAILLAITYGLVAQSSTLAASRSVFVARGDAVRVHLPPPEPLALGAVPPSAGAGAIVQARAYAGKVTQTFRRLTSAQAAQLRSVEIRANRTIANQRSTTLDALLTRSALALGITALISIGLGWLMAGRALRPVRTMSGRARGISEHNLDERLAVDGPDDELKELGDTIDALLARLEAAFESQRRFVANASHELRTPITLERTLLEVAMADPDASVESLRATCRRVLASGEQQERLIEALLTLARSQRGLESPQPVDLAEVAGGALDAISTGLRVDAELGEAPTRGDAALLERLVANLLDNAVEYNRPDGWVHLWTGGRDGLSTLEVTNSGPIVPAGRVEALLEPFRRIQGDRLARNGRPAGERRLGLGLSIVAAIADAHGARLALSSRAEGGLVVQIAFPAGTSSYQGSTLESRWQAMGRGSALRSSTTTAG